MKESNVSTGNEKSITMKEISISRTKSIDLKSILPNSKSGFSLPDDHLLEVEVAVPHLNKQQS
jgi:hypothetical protein